MTATRSRWPLSAQNRRHRPVLWLTAAAVAAAVADAWRRFGTPQGALNFGDCFTYALAERDQLPILCTGDGFSATDLEVRRPPE